MQRGTQMPLGAMWTIWTTMLLMTSCAGNPGDFCDVAEPIPPIADASCLKKDVKRAIVAHNRIGREQCKW